MEHNHRVSIDLNEKETWRIGVFQSKGEFLVFFFPEIGRTFEPV